jgi:hypothetical protein
MHLNAAFFLRTLWFLGLGFTGAFTAFYAQASSPNYQQLFWGVLPVASIHFVLAALYFVRIRDWSRWAALGLGCIALISFGEMTLRVWS